MNLRGGGSVGIGLGYRFSDRLRGDIGLSYWSRDVSGNTGLELSGQSWRFDENASASAVEAMANAYVDIGTYGLFTPYAGAGIGVTFLDYGTLTGHATCTGSACDPDYVGTHGGMSSTRLTWALSLGTAIDLTESLKLDLGYRFARVSGGNAFGWDEADTAAGATGAQSRDRGFSMQQLRIGARFQLP